MKLKKLIKIFDEFTHVRIWTDEDLKENEDAEPEFDGYMADIPLYLIDYKIMHKTFEDKIDIRNITNKHGVAIPTLFMIVKEGK